MREKFMQLNGFVEKMNSTNSINGKIEVLKSYVDNDFIRSILFYTYNPFYNFYVTSENCKKRSNLSSGSYDDVLYLLDALRGRKITGNDAISYVNGFVNLYKDFEDLIFCIIDRNLKIRVDVKLINKVFVNLIPEFSVALAVDITKINKEKVVNFKNDTWFVSRKLDGCRCITIIQPNGDIRFYSREGKEFHTLNVLREDLKSWDYGVVLDGEICIVDENGNENFQDIMSEIGKKDKKTKEYQQIQHPKYFIFDMLTIEDFNNGYTIDTPLSSRYEWMSAIFNDLYTGNCVVPLQQTPVEDDEDLNNWKEVTAELGWEGVMLRKNTDYKGKRSNDLLKVKQFLDSEYIVKDVEFGIMRVIVDGLEVEEKMLSNIVIEHKGYRVNVGSGFSLEQRRKYFKNPESIIGSTVTVKYFQESKDQHGNISLRFPILKHIYENGREV